MLSLMFALKSFRPYLLAKKFVVITVDHTFPHVMKHMETSTRISKWIVEMQEFNYTFLVEDSTRAYLADMLTHHFDEKKINPILQGEISPPPQVNLEDAYILHFDGAFRKKIGRAAGGIVVKDPQKRVIIKKGSF